MTIRVKRFPCVLCDSDDSFSYRHIENLDPRVAALLPEIAISICRSCGMISQNPCWVEEDLARFYSSNEDKVVTVELATETVTTTEALDRVGALMKVRPPPARLLEIGSAEGTFLDAARRAGYTVTGTEPSAPSIAKARSLYGDLDVREGLIENVALDETFDIVCHFFVLEHALRPTRFLASARGALATGGLMLFEVPSVSAFARLPFANYLFPYQHVSHFYPGTLTTMLTRCDFETQAMDGALGRSAKRYGMRVLARADGSGARGSATFEESVALLNSYFSRRDTILGGIAERVGDWEEKLAARPGPLVIFGSGENGRIVLRSLGGRSDKTRAILFCDNDHRLQGAEVDGIRVIDPNEVPGRDPALVIVASTDYQEDMVAQLVTLGIPASRIERLYV